MNKQNNYKNMTSKYSDAFYKALETTLAKEGYYSNDIVDKGGETYRGISRNNFPAWEGWEVIDEIKDKNTINHSELLPAVTKFYYNEFWKYLKADNFDTRIALELFDTAVNQGRVMAASFFQDSLNLLNNAQLLVDGKIGKYTIDAYNNYVMDSTKKKRNSDEIITVLLKCLNGHQFMRYVKLVNANGTLRKFIYGWINQRIK